MNDIMQAPNKGGSHPTVYEQRGYAAVGLDNPKTPANAGSALRACGVYDVSMLALSGDRFRKATTDTGKAWRHLPLLQVEDLKQVIPYDCVPVAIEITPDAKPLTTYTHPERAMYIFGAEDNTLGRRVLSYCRDVIYIPGNGCSNLAATINVVLYDRMLKQQQ